MVRHNEFIEEKIRAWASDRRTTWFEAFASGESFASLKVESLEVVRFVAYLQSEFRVTIRPSDFFGEAFQSLGALVEFLKKLKAE